MADQEINCSDCKNTFTFTEGEQAFFAERQFQPPRRCKGCRDHRKAMRENPPGSVDAPAPAPREPRVPYKTSEHRRKGGRRDDRD